MTATASPPKPKLSIVAAIADTGEVATISLSDLVEAIRQHPVEPPPRPLLIRQVDAPAYVGISRPTMFRLIAAGDWPAAADIPGSATVYRRKDLDEWVAKRKAARR